ncbi:MAG: di-trans,poly-cis-decaprenylcistransferase [Candidatus Pacebacteria bacterium]|nr:di-trans,poly-cis-decaprenylcistransferase [Candidatus Paceibacterota bacterium]MBP9867027.1 di-trans,poly-cis-decaprenylcistransferase [Candidatus Paceibacterota bacterium]
MNHSNSLSHVAIIPDGNRRWAKEKNIPSVLGHERGYQRIRECLVVAKELGISYVTIWAFSTENWKREVNEVDDLMSIFIKGLSMLHDDAKKDKVRVVHIGRRDRLNPTLLALIETIEHETKEYAGFTVCIALDYGGEDEVKRAIQSMNTQSSKDIHMFLDTMKVNVPNPDVIIRTGGEKRTSGFMPLQTLYSEWFFLDTLFPDFDGNAFRKVVEEYFLRCRRFGK